MSETPVRVEVRRLAALAWPVAATQVGNMLLGVVDTLMLGRFSVEALSAAALANVWVWGTLHVAMGVVFGMDPIVAQAHGARDGERVALALQRGLVLALGLSVPLGLAWLLTEEFLRAMGQDPALAAAAERFTRLQIPSVPFFLGFWALRQYLQGREIVRPALWVMVGANLVNLAGNWAFVYGHLGMPRLGLEGSAIATSLSRAACLVGLAALVLRAGLHEGAWVPWSRRALSPRGIAEILALGLPVGLQISLEAWAFSGAALLAGRIGTEALAAHTIVLNMAALSFMMPLGIALAAVTRVGNLIGAQRLEEAQRAAWVALGLGAAVMAASALVFLGFRFELPRLYTTDAAVVALAATILPIAAAFQIFDGVQVVACGVLRGMGRTRPAAVFNAVSYWLLGIPLGWWLGLHAGWGLAGIWWGLCIGLAVVASLLLGWIRHRGPAHAAVQLA
ncbi:MAG: MATE family efflux transporter [Deltaproteobacteria bacterium]|nr:MATE family efflux transporter [Deltaproteobacteria bacterium]